MQTETIIALAKYLSQQEATLSPGVHNVNEEVRLQLTGSITKNADCEYIPTTSVPWKMVTALLLEKMGITRDAATKMILDCCKEAIELERNGKDTINANITDRLNHVSDAEKRVNNLVEALPKKLRSGVTKVNVTVEVLPIIEETHVAHNLTIAG